MSTPVIQVSGLAKLYRIGCKEEIPDTLTSAALGWIRRPLENFRRLRQLNTFGKSNGEASDGIIWALRDVSFAVAEGEVVGIVGRNGAGKSTLLKILSRITEPTRGQAIIRGRVSSLLEVGTGFHPELSGRENIYMNGTILGMMKREIDRKFDEIVEFSGVEKFLDTPIKRYSSGMQVRLAFSVAAHLEPEILIIDEVLAVGDAAFQKKCLGKMQDVARSGRTVLFVSHNMAAVEYLCSTAIALSDGRVTGAGPTNEVVGQYLAAASGGSYQPMSRGAGMKSVVQEVVIQELGADEPGVIRCGSDVGIHVHIQSPTSLPQARIGLRVDSLSGTPLLHLQSEIATGSLIDLPASGSTCCTIRRLPLLPGRYSLAVAVFSMGALVDHLSPAIEFDVDHGDYFGTGRLPQNSLALFLHQSEWQTNGNGEKQKCD